MKKITNLIPLYLPESNTEWLTKSFAGVIMYEIELLSGEGRSDEQISAMMNNFIKATLENEIFHGGIMSYCCMIYPHHDKKFLEKNLRLQKDNYLQRKRIEKVKQNTFSNRHFLSFYLPFVDPKIKKEKEVIDYYHKRKEQLKNISEIIRNTLLDNFYSIRQLDYKEMYKVWFSIVNPYNEEINYDEIIYNDGNEVILNPPACEQLVVSDVYNYEDHLYYNGMYIKCFSINMPAYVTDDLSYMVFQRLNFPLRYVIHIYFPESQFLKRKEMLGKESSARFMSLGSARVFNKKKIDDINSLLSEIQENKGIFTDLSGFVVAYSRDKMELESNVAKLISAFSLNDIKLFNEYIMQKDVYFSWGLPGLGGGYVTKTRRFTTTSNVSGRFLFLYDSFVGERQKPVIMFKNRFFRLAGFSPFSESQAKYGGVIIAPSGSGKTFFMNNVINFSLNMKDSPYVGIIDMALYPSYEMLVEFLGGQIIKIDSSGTNGINPLEFVYPLDRVPERHIAYLREIFFPAIGNFNAVQLQLLERFLRKMYHDFLDVRPKEIEISAELLSEFRRFKYWVDAKKFYFDRYKKTRDNRDLYLSRYAHSMSMPLITDLLMMLAMDPSLLVTTLDKTEAEYIRRQIEAGMSGIKNRIFNRPTSVVIKENARQDLIYFYFGDIINFPELSSLCFLTVYNFLINEYVIYNEDISYFSELYTQDELDRRIGKKKLLIVDEVHNLKSSRSCYKVIERAFRQGRTLGMALWCISQGLREITETEEGKAMVENAGIKIFLRHTSPDNPNQLAVDYVCNLLGFNERMRDLLMDLKKTNVFSDILIASEGVGAGVIRFEPTPEERWLNTTNHVETAIRRNLLNFLINNKGYKREEAIEETIKILSQRYPNGKQDNLEVDYESLV